MVKRRTRKEKEKALEHFKISWKSSLKKERFEPGVKGHLTNTDIEANSENILVKKASPTVNQSNFVHIKKDLIKSLVLASLILGMEVVLYLAWH